MGFVHYSPRPANLLIAMLGVLGWSITTDSYANSRDDTTSNCVLAYESAQQYRKDNDLLAARAQLQDCAATDCPVLIQSDCTTWLAEVVETIPSIVLEAKQDGENVFDVSVSMDGSALTSELDGKPMEVNPGLHTFAFQHPGSPPLEKKVLVTPHERSQLISVAWKQSTPTRPRSEPRRERTRPIPLGVYLLSAVSIGGFGTFAVLGLSGKQTQRELESSCSPDCSDRQVTALKTRFLAANLAAGIGAVSAAGVLVVYLSRPEQETAVPSVAGIMPLRGGAAAQWSGSF